MGCTCLPIYYNLYMYKYKQCSVSKGHLDFQRSSFFVAKSFEEEVV